MVYPRAAGVDPQTAARQPTHLAPGRRPRQLRELRRRLHQAEEEVPLPALWMRHVQEVHGQGAQDVRASVRAAVCLAVDAAQPHSWSCIACNTKASKRYARTAKRARSRADSSRKRRPTAGAPPAASTQVRMMLVLLLLMLTLLLLMLTFSPGSGEQDEGWHEETGRKAPRWQEGREPRKVDTYSSLNKDRS